MVIIGNKSGQLANRLFVFAHFVGNARQYGYQLANPSFYDYAPYFDQLRGDFFCRYPAQCSPLAGCRALQGAYFRTLATLVKLKKKLGFKGETLGLFELPAGSDDYLIDSPEFIRIREAARNLVVKGWTFRDEGNLARHAEEVRRFFQPVAAHAANVSRLMETARQGCDLLVGVHIRQGDYRTWQDGRYFYETGQYAEIMRNCLALADGRRIKFLVCSNAPQDETLFQGLPYLMGNDHPLEDLYSFARCDLLIGPPSTYTMWASFYGSVPLFVVKSPGEPVLAEGFKVCTG